MFIETGDLDIASYVDDSFPFTCSTELDEVLLKLVIEVVKTPNPQRYYLLTTSKSEVDIEICGNLIKRESRANLLKVE